MSLKIGKLAKATQVNVQTVRFYERENLLPIPKRSPGGYRLYELTDVDRIRFIKQAQNLGFSLDEIRDLLSLRVDANSNCSQVKTYAEIKITEIKTKISELARIAQTLESLVGDCNKKKFTEACPILQSLNPKKLGKIKCCKRLRYFG